MAQMNNLLVSWNFDLINPTNGSGELNVYDTRNSFYGAGVGFTANSTDFLIKEEILVHKKTLPENLESSETIQLLDEDDTRITDLHKPSSVQLVVENSMFQIISDDMLNMFSTIDSYSFKFIEPFNKYKFSYNNLEKSRYEYFSRVVEKPNLEKYIEFYKWIDSSLSYMLEQLLPESSNNIKGLKNTVESHILERNKYRHILPLLVQENKTIKSGITVTNTKTLSKSNFLSDISSSIEDVCRVENIKNYNFKENYQILQGSGKSAHYRAGKENKTIFRNNFSSVDGLSDLYKDGTGEYSVYNDLNYRAYKQRMLFNMSESMSTGIQGSTSSCAQGCFSDNKFIQRNIPFTASNYYHTESVGYFNFPNEEILFRHYTNLLIDENVKNSYFLSNEIVEPPLEFTNPVKHNVKVSSGKFDIDIFSPYSTQVHDFSLRNLFKENSTLQKHIVGGYNFISDKDTFFVKAAQESNNFKFNKIEKLDLIFPRTDLVGLAEVRLKGAYEEWDGWFQASSLSTLSLNWYDTAKIPYWSNNSFNNNASKVRSFWREDIEPTRTPFTSLLVESGRKRVRGKDLANISLNTERTGSFNSLNFPNLLEKELRRPDFYHQRNLSPSMWSMDGRVEYNVATGSEDYDYWLPVISCSNEVYGELAPYSHLYQMFLASTQTQTNSGVRVPPKPSFTHHVFLASYNETLTDFEGYNENTNKRVVFNKSYQVPLDCNLVPFYHNYDDFRANIKHKSQDHSIIPEFLVSRYEKVIKEQYVELYKEKTGVIEEQLADGTISVREIPVIEPDYLTINGGERYEQMKPSNFKVDLKRFIDKNSNKIKFKLNGIKKLLPYNGFYPQQRTTQIATIFNDSYMTDTGYVPDSERLTINHNTGSFAGLLTFNESESTADKKQTCLARTLSVMQPLFMPGILFNTIKAGIAMPWPTYLTNLGTPTLFKDWIAGSVTSQFSPYITSDKLFSVRDLNTKFPFETLLDPANYIKYHTDLAIETAQLNYGLNEYALPYLDPTHLAVELQPSGSQVFRHRRVLTTDLIDNLFKAEDRYYKSAINNFLAETINFFLKDGELSYVTSANSGSISVVSGNVYRMDVVMRKDADFSMFSPYNTSPELQEYAILPSGSLFGPPVGGAEESIVDHCLEEAYYPYSPPYWRDNEDRVSIIYRPTESKVVEIRDIIRECTIEYASGSVSDGPNMYKKSTIKDSFNFKLEYNGAWTIQLKMETPIFNFNNCSTIEVVDGTYRYDLDYSYNRQ